MRGLRMHDDVGSMAAFLERIGQRDAGSSQRPRILEADHPEEATPARGAVARLHVPTATIEGHGTAKPGRSSWIQTHRGLDRGARAHREPEDADALAVELRIAAQMLNDRGQVFHTFIRIDRAGRAPTDARERTALERERPHRQPREPVRHQGLSIGVLPIQRPLSAPTTTAVQQDDDRERPRARRRAREDARLQHGEAVEPGVAQAARPTRARHRYSRRAITGSSPHRGCVTVSMSASFPSFTTFRLRSRAGRISSGLTMGPSPYRPKLFARVAKSVAGPSRLTPTPTLSRERCLILVTASWCPTS